MAQQWVTDRVRETFRQRPDEASVAASDARRAREWLASLGLEPSVAAIVDEPLAALEDGLRGAAGHRPQVPAAR